MPGSRSITGAPHCPCCHSERTRPFHHQTLLCLECGHAWFPLDRLQVNLDDLYNSNYFTDVDYSNYVSEEPVLKRTFSQYCGRLLQTLPRNSNVLEVGCAYGFFLDVAKPFYAVTGIDVARDAVRHARTRGHDVHVGRLEEQSFPPSRFDAVCLWDTLEHLTDPETVISRCNVLLRDDGYIYLTTGDLSSVLARVQGPRWRMFHPPSHLQYFTRKSLHAILSKAGFGEVDISTIAQWHSVENALGGLQLHSKGRLVRTAATTLQRVTPRFLKDFNCPVPTFDILWVRARKRQPAAH